MKCFFVFLLSFVVINLKAQPKTTYFSLEEALKNPEIVFRLDLSHQKMSQIPVSISQLKRLKRLDLSYNQLSDLSPILDSLKDLRHLYLNNNQVKKLPSKLFQLVKLKKLCLSNNQLTQLPKEIKNLRKLKGLDLTGNNISKLPKELWELEDIEILRFDDPIFLTFTSPFLPNKHPIFNWITMDAPPDSIGGQPLSFYLNHPQIDPYSKLYVQGKYALDHDKAACVFVDSIFTKNSETAIFYAYLYAATLLPDSDDFPLFELLYQKRRAFLLEQPCLFIAYYQDYLKEAYYMDEGILDSNKYQQIISQLKNNCSAVLDNEADFYFNCLNFFLPQSDRKGQIGVRVNDTLEAIEYICLYDAKGTEMGNTYQSAYYRDKKWFERILPGEYILVFYSKAGYKKRKEKGNQQLTDNTNVILRKEVVLKSIHESLFIEIGKAPVFIPRDTLLPPPPPPPPPSPIVQTSAVSEEFEVVEVIDEETGEVIEVYIDEETPIDSNYIKEEQARRDSCNRLFYTTRKETLDLFLDVIYNPASKTKEFPKESMRFLTAIKHYLEGEFKSLFGEPNPFDFPILPSYILGREEAFIVLDVEEDGAGKFVKLPPRHEKIIRKEVWLYYSNSPLEKKNTINRCNKYNNGCAIWMNYPLYQVKDHLLPAFCSEQKIQLDYGQDAEVDQLLEMKNDCDNIWKQCTADANQKTFATLKGVPNLYFTSSKDPMFPARGIYFRTSEQKLVELWYHEMKYEFCGCDH